MMIEMIWNDDLPQHGDRNDDFMLSYMGMGQYL
jgi:hypothetical protein